MVYFRYDPAPFELAIEGDRVSCNTSTTTQHTIVPTAPLEESQDGAHGVPEDEVLLVAVSYRPPKRLAYQSSSAGLQQGDVLVPKPGL